MGLHVVCRQGLLYVRRSKSDIVRSRSVSAQLRVARADAAVLGWEVVGVHEDDGVGASRHSRKERAGWPAVVRDLRAGRADALWLLDATRGDRELGRWVELLNYCRDHGVLIYLHLSRRTYDLRIPSDYKELASDGVTAAHDSDEKSLKVKLGKEEAAIEGLQPGGRAPYGYLRVYDPQTKRFDWVTDPKTAPVVADVTARVGRGEPLYAVAKSLNEAGVASPSGKAWAAGTVRHVATAAYYRGKRVHGGVEYPGRWPALVDEDTQAAARRVVGQRAGKGKKAPRPGRVVYLASHLARCAVCGAGMAGARPRDRRPYYVCSAPGRHATVNLADFDEFLTRTVVKRLARPDVFQRLSAPDDAEVVAARRELLTLEQRLSEIYAEGAQGKITARGVATMEAQLLPQVADARRRAETAAVPKVVVELLEGTTCEADVLARWNSDQTSLATRREVVRALVEELTVNPANGTRGIPGRLDPKRVTLRWRGEKQPRQRRPA